MMYLPCWTDGLSFREQYDAYWIANEYEKAVKNGDGTSFYSLLPLRFDNLGYYNSPETYNYLDFTSKTVYEYPYEYYHNQKIFKCRYLFALEVWKKSADIIKEEFPEIEKISFDDQLQSGVYPIHFAYRIDAIKNRQIEIIKNLIKQGFSIDEVLNLSYQEEGNTKKWHYEGIIGPSYKKCKELFENTSITGFGKTIEVKKNVSYSYEECEEYFRIFDEHIIQLGNQIRVYQIIQKENAPLFDAIKENSIDRIKECVKNGYSLNAISTNGNSAFASILFGLFHDEEKEEWDDIEAEETELLDYLFEHGANPAIYGVNSDDCPLVEAVVNHRNKTAKWLLEKGVSPNIFPFIDDLCDEDVTLTDWLEGSWHDEITPDDVTEMIQILKKYASGKQD